MRALDIAQRQELRLQIARFDDHQVVGVLELSVILDTTPGNIYRLLYSAPQSLPPCLTAFGRRKVWLMRSVRVWLQAQCPAAEPGAAAATAPRLGRPRRNS